MSQLSKSDAIEKKSKFLYFVNNAAYIFSLVVLCVMLFVSSVSALARIVDMLDFTDTFDSQFLSNTIAILSAPSVISIFVSAVVALFGILVARTIHKNNLEHSKHVALFSESLNAYLTTFKKDIPNPVLKFLMKTLETLNSGEVVEKIITTRPDARIHPIYVNASSIIIESILNLDGNQKDKLKEIFYQYAKAISYKSLWYGPIFREDKDVITKMREGRYPGRTIYSLDHFENVNNGFDEIIKNICEILEITSVEASHDDVNITTQNEESGKEVVNFPKQKSQ